MIGLCQRRGCPRTATHALRFCAPGDSAGASTREAIIGVELCQAHVDEADPKAFVEAGPEILTLLGLEPGDEGLIYPDGILLTSAEYAAFRAAAEPQKAN